MNPADYSSISFPFLGLEMNPPRYFQLGPLTVHLYGLCIGLGLILGTPYLIIGLIWSLTHTAHLHEMHGVDLVVSFLGSIVSWPVLLFSNVCMQ